MKKRALVITLAILGVLIVGGISLIMILTLGNAPSTDTDRADTSTLRETKATQSTKETNGSQNVQKPQNTQGTQSTKPPKKESIEITKVYEFYDEFKMREYEQRTFRDSVSGYSLPYCIFEPKDYSPDKEYAVLLFLHGAGEVGSDNQKQLTVLKNMFIINGDQLKDVIIVCPQALGWWSVNEGYNDQKGWLGAAVRLVDNIIDSYSVDKDRLYVMGISMGGYGTWDALSYYPDKFAAGIPICGGGKTSFAKVLSDIPIWIYHGDADTTVSVTASDAMYSTIKQAGGNKIRFNRLKGVGHNAWDPAMCDRELFSWLVAQNKSKNLSGKYSAVPTLKIVNDKGETVITSADTINPYVYCFDNSRMEANITFNDEGLDKLKKAYEGGGEFTFVFGTQKLFSFRPTGVAPEQQFKFKVNSGENN